MSNQSIYGIKKSVDLSYDDAVAKVTEALKAEGFGVLTEIDVQKTLKMKIGKDFTRYVILGACNPNLAFNALSNELDIGLLLPCNVVVYENPDDQSVVVGAIDPAAMIQITGRKDLDEFANSVKEKISRAIASV